MKLINNNKQIIGNCETQFKHSVVVQNIHTNAGTLSLRCPS